MNRCIHQFAVLSGVLLVSTACLIASAHAAGCKQPARTRFARSESVVITAGSFVVVPFAVPVAVPVATIAQPTVLYGYSAAAGGSARVSGDAGNSRADDAIAPDDIAEMDHKLAADAIVARRCASCHGAADAKGGLVLESISLDELERPQRIELLRRITSTDPSLRMPKEAPLTQSEVDVLVEALVK